MTAQFYQKITAPFQRHPWLCHVLRLVNLATTLCVYSIYLFYLLYLFLCRSRLLIPAVVVPAVGFLLLSWYRSRMNRPRPYETLDINPIIHKKAKGHSFPSRHVFSVFIITATIGSQSFILGVFLFVIGLLISACRIIGGVHFPIDVLAGLVLGLLSGTFGCIVFQMIL